MPFPLGAVLSATPSVISAAADIIRAIKDNKSKTAEAAAHPEQDQLAELSELIKRQEQIIERQAEVIEDLAENNRNLALAVRNNRILVTLSLVIAVSGALLSVLR